MLTLIRAGILASSLFAILFASSFTNVAHGDDLPTEQDPLSRINAFSRHGEFTRAFDEVKHLNSVAQRDDAHAVIARGQLRFGLVRSSVETASYVEDDTTRSQLLTEASSARAEPISPRGGGVQPDFDSLIDLITTTVQPESWEDLGGPGSIAPFATGVYVDSQGTLQRVTKLSDNTLLSSVHDASKIAAANQDVAATSALRKVSLTRLEKEAQLRWALGKPLSEEMRNMAGIYEIKYVLVYPEQGEIVIAGPAGPWQQNPEGRFVNQATARPVLQLDDFVVLLRNAIAEKGRFGCAITPTQEGLKKAQQYLDASSDKPLHPRQRDSWLAGLRDAVGKQEIDVHGIHPDTRAAQIIVEADYHMKRIGMGLEDGTAGVPSYLEMVTIPPGGSPPPMDVLRWWFTLNYKAINATHERNAFELQGPGVQVLCENEMLDAQGGRIHTNTASTLNATFARNFTQHYDALSVKYPIYAEMKNIFDLAIVASLIEKERLADQAHWNMVYFGPQGNYTPQTSTAPQDVESIMNMRVIDRKHIIAGVSGGVNFDASKFVTEENIHVDEYGLMSADRLESAVPQTIDHHGWWWD
ncbi:DUF1598 domain-containing protein [Blastopirellula marina]|uniref:DUF1598 domain-containing protein n=1 Tax=Blastopirellula marina TaxID=124 RepID=A0A2S8G2A0_9BACT|nr:DUF1598 domain-containing protein [Blastopirellula marina]PQO38568.1 hypothetical protein C5Y98_11000 [Blastopirellula marina]PTL45225.1 DUF1598 domain-containing protein [Blastopirellula marina]